MLRFVIIIIKFESVTESIKFVIIFQQKKQKNNFRIIAAEDVGTVEPWNTDLTGNVLFVVGAEREGVSQEVLEACDEVVRLPMDGFVPSYNLQVAISVLAVEALRQKKSD